MTWLEYYKVGVFNPFTAFFLTLIVGLVLLGSLSWVALVGYFIGTLVGSTFAYFFNKWKERAV